MDTYIPGEARMIGRDDFLRSQGDRDMDESYRRRSPGPYQDRRMPRPRNRSRSPVVIDRYQPEGRPPREDYYHSSRNRDDRRRPPSPGPNAPANIDRYVPGQDAPDPALLINPVVDPLKLDSQVGFSYYAEWWRREKAIKEEKERQKTGGRRAPERVRGEREVREERDQEKTQIQTAYDTYKEELQAKMARNFVQAHKNDEWFKERYVPEIRDPFVVHLSQHRRENYDQWESDLTSGLFDEFTLEGIYRSESDGVGGVLEKEEGETVATGEVLGVADLVPCKGGDIRDPAGTQTALLIKTISPTVSRSKLEEFCKEHLGEGPGGYKWLSLSDPNPSKRYHRIGWIVLQPGGENLVKIKKQPIDEPKGEADDDDQMNVDKDSGSNDATMEDGNEKETQAKSDEVITLGPEHRALEAVNSMTIHDETRGDFTCHVGIHNPPTALRKKALWDLFSAPERVNRDLELATRVCSKLEKAVSPDLDALNRIEAKVEDLRIQGLLKPVYSGAKNSKVKPEQDLDVDGFDEGDDGEVEEEEEGAIDEDVDDEQILVQKKKLDLLVEYFRRVHHFCFFCVFECDSVHELARKCPGGHLRRPMASLTPSAKRAAKASAVGDSFPLRRDSFVEQENGNNSPPARHQRGNSKPAIQLQRAFNWVKTYEDKLMQLMEPEQVDLKKLGGMPLEDALADELSKFVKQDENKWRCKVPECTKIFRAEHFWRKHVETRHPEWFETLKQDLILVNTYVLDPSHIAPSRSDANSNGHFPNPSNHFSGGTPRGFNLNLPMGFPMMQSLGGPGALPTFMGSHAVNGPGGNWAGGMGQNGEERRGTGPIRRGGSYNRHLRSGPYDRRPGDSRDARWASARGGYGDLRGNRATSGGRWGDGAGVAAVGPREAVQGRSLKSYEDLDAVGGSGSGELNY